MLKRLKRPEVIEKCVDCNRKRVVSWVCWITPVNDYVTRIVMCEACSKQCFEFWKCSTCSAPILGSLCFWRTFYEDLNDYVLGPVHHICFECRDIEPPACPYSHMHEKRIRWEKMSRFEIGSEEQIALEIAFLTLVRQ